MTKIKKTLLIVGTFQLGGLFLLFISTATFLSFEIAMLSSMFIVVGSLYSYRNMIQSRVGDVNVEEIKDSIDMMDDPYDLYEEEREQEITDIKQMIKEEKARHKGNILKNTTKNASAMVSIYRLLPYAFLILGFIALNNNHTLNVLPYLVGLAGGIPIGYLLAKKLFIS